jgi:hypothetical protein
MNCILENEIFDIEMQLSDKDKIKLYEEELEKKNNIEKKELNNNLSLLEMGILKCIEMKEEKKKTNVNKSEINIYNNIEIEESEIFANKEWINLINDFEIPKINILDLYGEIIGKNIINTQKDLNCDSDWETIDSEEDYK